MAASPLEPAGGVVGVPGLAEGVGQQVLDLVDGERDEAGVGWGLWRRGLRGAGPGCRWGPEPGGGDGADGEGGHDQDEVAADRGVEAGLALVQAEVVLSRTRLSSTGQRSPAALISLALDGPALGHVAVVEGQLAGLQVAADQQAVPRGGGARARPRRTSALPWTPCRRSGPPRPSCPSAASSPRPRRSSWSRPRA